MKTEIGVIQHANGDTTLLVGEFHKRDNGWKEFVSHQYPLHLEAGDVIVFHQEFTPASEESK